MASIILNDLCLDYMKIRGAKSLKKVLLSPFIEKNQSTPKKKLFRALNNINLTLKDDDRLGLIGRNGAGKSSLLRVIAGIYQPTGGILKIEGNISTLLSTTVGINREATGYENIELLGILHGSTKKQMRQCFKDLETFTELGERLNDPVKSYSVGMLIRLAFGIVTSIRREIVLIDEVIGAGDAVFIQKASQRIKELIHQAKIVVIASHSSEVITKMCNKVLFLHQGEIQFFGDVEEGMKAYEKLYGASFKQPMKRMAPKIVEKALK